MNLDVKFAAQDEALCAEVDCIGVQDCHRNYSDTKLSCGSINSCHAHGFHAASKMLKCWCLLGRMLDLAEVPLFKVTNDMPKLKFPRVPMYRAYSLLSKVVGEQMDGRRIQFTRGGASELGKISILAYH